MTALDHNRPHTAWADGWYRTARHLKSPNFGPRPQGALIDLVVLHSISLPPGDYNGDHVQRFFMNQLNWDEHAYFDTLRELKVSSHFYIRKDGALWQFVNCDDRAWHAGISHYRGRDNCNDDSIGIELEGLEGEPFESEQYSTLTHIIEAISERYPIAHIAGHEHIAPGRKHDPGHGFDWSRIQELLHLPDRYFP